MRKEQIVPREIGISSEIFSRLLRLCLLVARIFQGTGRSQPVAQLLALLGQGSVCLAGFSLLES